MPPKSLVKDCRLSRAMPKLLKDQSLPHNRSVPKPALLQEAPEANHHLEGQLVNKINQ